MFDFSDANFQQEVIANPKLVVIVVGTPLRDIWEFAEPMLAEFAESYPDICVFGRLDSKANPKVIAQYSITTHTTYLFFKNGVLTYKCDARISKSELQGRIGSNL